MTINDRAADGSEALLPVNHDKMRPSHPGTKIYDRCEEAVRNDRSRLTNHDRLQLSMTLLRNDDMDSVLEFEGIGGQDAKPLDAATVVRALPAASRRLASARPACPRPRSDLFHAWAAHNQADADSNANGDVGIIAKPLRHASAPFPIAPPLTSISNAIGTS